MIENAKTSVKILMYKKVLSLLADAWSLSLRFKVLSTLLKLLETTGNLPTKVALTLMCSFRYNNTDSIVTWIMSDYY